MYKLLLVDDQKIIRDGFKRILLRSLPERYDIYEADCGNAAEKIALDLKPQIVITDVKMPDFSGLELIKRLKTKLKGSKYVVISAYENFRFAKEAIKLEVSDYLLKPINRSDVEELMEKLINSLQEQKADTNLSIEKFSETGVNLDNYLDIKSFDEFESTSDSSIPHNRIVEYVIDYVNENYSKDLSLAYMANLVDRNYSYFSSLFSSETGINFSNYLRNVRMEKAKELLSDLKYKINDVSHKVGYLDGVQFCKTFGKYTGMPPGKYRSMNVK